MLTSAQVDHFRDQGYVIIDGFEPSMIEPLRAATGRTVAKGRSGEWGDVRTCNGDDLWGVSALLHPDLGEPIFGEYMASPHVVEVAQDLLGTSSLRLGLTNLLCNPLRDDYALHWHRDGGAREARGQEELDMLTQFQESVQWNAALYDESCLLVVPETHRRNMTEAEREVRLHNPTGQMPGQVRVELKAGQTVYYNAMMLHRGEYPGGRRRETLHANMVTVPESDRDLFRFHYDAVQFMAEPGFRESIPERLWPLHDNWLTLAAHFGEAGTG